MRIYYRGRWPINSTESVPGVPGSLRCWSCSKEQDRHGPYLREWNWLTGKAIIKQELLWSHYHVTCDVSNMRTTGPYVPQERELAWGPDLPEKYREWLGVKKYPREQPGVSWEKRRWRQSLDQVRRSEIMQTLQARWGSADFPPRQ